ncbi:MAG: triphosphoribosyl-dephospho-CoA synthase [Parabacteroides sp.]|nr:triphosphoribosyl-dephospho-CoA synthase [Parabacteroides sp.]MDO4755115.1 triphosphoribosyl-dephospho-CoA synthase [Parabacteroides sp.]
MNDIKLKVERVDINDINNNNPFISCELSPINERFNTVAQYLTQAILLEVCTHPKPGLVTRLSNGSHSDMSILTFMMSSAILSKAFYDLENIGKNHKGTIKELFNEVRKYGIVAERQLLVATKGINTQRGILFAGGLVSAAAGYASRTTLDINRVIEVIKEMAVNLVRNELISTGERRKTAGEKLYRKYGITGIRGEVEKGFPSVIEHGLPALREAMHRCNKIDYAFLHTLINLMAVVEDTNVVWRTDYDMLVNVKRIAKDILDKGSVFTEQGRTAIKEAETMFIEKRISPGGSADLLSVTIALYLFENREFAIDIF